MEWVINETEQPLRYPHTSTIWVSHAARCTLWFVTIDQNFRVVMCEKNSSAKKTPKIDCLLCRLLYLVVAWVITYQTTSYCIFEKGVFADNGCSNLVSLRLVEIINSMGGYMRTDISNKLMPYISIQCFIFQCKSDAGRKLKQRRSDLF